MSTRATYKIDGHYFYIHHDGYLAGAAEYFYNALTLIKGKYYSRKLAEDFIRANLGASFTTDHDDHGDTEFKYTVTKDELKAFKRNTNTWDTWTTVYTGSLIEFVNTYCDLIKENSDLKLVHIKLQEHCYEEIHNIETIKFELEERLRIRDVWSKNGGGKGANWNINEYAINAIYSAYPSLKS